jgi:hypothetical protein
VCPVTTADLPFERNTASEDFLPAQAHCSIVHGASFAEHDSAVHSGNRQLVFGVDIEWNWF